MVNYQIPLLWGFDETYMARTAGYSVQLDAERCPNQAHAVGYLCQAHAKGVTLSHAHAEGYPCQARSEGYPSQAHSEGVILARLMLNGGMARLMLKGGLVRLMLRVA